MTLFKWLKREGLHAGAALGITVLVAVSAEMAGIGSFDDVSLTGTALTAIRSLATGIVTLGSRWVIGAD